MDQKSREAIHDFVNGVKAAARKSHPPGPGGARVCICGAGCGGSKACNFLYFLRDVIEVEDMEMLRIIAELL